MGTHESRGIPIEDAAPVRVIGDGELREVEFAYTREGSAGLEATGETFVLKADQLFLAIGQELALIDQIDADLRRRNPEWGLRRVEDFTAEAELRGLAFAETRAMPANNLMLLYRRR